MQLRVNRQTVCIVMLSIMTTLGQGTSLAQWTAFNDCLRESGDNTADHVSGWTIHSNDQNHNTGPLINYETGSSDNMPTVTFTMGDSGLRVSGGTAGGNPLPGTDAHDLFADIIDFGPNGIYYGTAGWWVEMEFSGLNPEASYSFAGTAIRSSNYPNRVSQFTLLDALSSVNNSSDGVPAKLPDSTLLIAGDNSLTGYVVRWDDIKPSPNGTFGIRAEATAESDDGKAYPLGGFMLSETSSTSVPKGPEVDAGEYDALPWPLRTVHLYPIVETESPNGLDGLSYSWSLLAGPQSVRFDPSETMADPNIIFPEPGEYELELTVQDSEGLQGSGRVTITVLEPSLVGDLNGNARVNLRDLELFAAQWLDTTENLSNFDAQAPVNFQDFAMLAANWDSKESTSLVINEILARNDVSNMDPQNEYEDWIEILNVGQTLVDLAGMYLTDDLSNPTMWQFPTDQPIQTYLAPGQRLLIWADNDVMDSGFHTNFQLSAETGGHVGLFEKDGVTLVDSLEFEGQTPDVSYGHDPDGTGQLTTLRPTPGQSNTGAILPVIDALAFSAERGFYQDLVQVDISTATPGTTIRYTLDGSSPSPQHGLIYNRPITLETTTCLRALAFRSGYKSLPIATHTYLFLDDVILQGNSPSGAQTVPEGYPSSWNGTSGNYQIDPDVVSKHPTMTDDLLSVPTLSLVMDIDDWFGSKGIYINQSQDGTERVCSLEFVDPLTGDSIQVNTAIAMQGGVSGGGTSLNRWKTLKLSMRPRFKPQTDDGQATGGPGKLDFRFFPNSPITRFNSLVVDAALNHSWLHSSSGQRDNAMYIQDQYVADLHNVMGGQSPHGDYVHLYLNGLYWGMYYLHERPDHSWISELKGGDEDEYDAIKHNRNGVINHGLGGNATANVDKMISAASAVSSDRTNLVKFNALADQLDLENFITYSLANWFTGNHDWPHKNWYATHHNVPGGLWRFHSWDAEHTVEGGNDVGESPLDIHNKLKNNAEYKMMFTDLIYKHFFNNGPLTAQVSAELYANRVDQVYQALVGESARWGDTRRSNPHTRDEWYDNQANKLAQFFPGRSAQVLGYLKNAGLYPKTLEPPMFGVNGAISQGGQIGDATVTIMGHANSIYYTTNGSDPRSPGGSVNPTARLYNGPLALTGSAHLKTRHYHDKTWSAIQETVFGVGPVAENLRITEIMYHPEDTGHAYDPNTEFIELQNTGQETVSLNLVRFTDGISFTFPAIELASKDFVLVVKDVIAFRAKYGDDLPVVGEYEGVLSNKGEHLRLVNAVDQVIHDFKYNDTWYQSTDGNGFSLVVTWPAQSDPTQWGDQTLWGPSHAKDGSPGVQDN